MIQNPSGELIRWNQGMDFFLFPDRCAKIQMNINRQTKHWIAQRRLVLLKKLFLFGPRCISVLNLSYRDDHLWAKYIEILKRRKKHTDMLKELHA